MTDVCTWVDGALVPAADATVSAHDRAFRSGEGVFETLRAYGDHPFRLDAHVRRAVAGAAELAFHLDADELTAAILATVRGNAAAFDGADSVVRLTTSPGRIDPDAPFPGAPAGGPTIVVASQRLQVDPDLHERGQTAISVPLVRELPHVKSVSYVVALTARRKAREAGADEALLVTPSGAVLEAAAANVAAVLDGRLVTPPVDDGLLAGVTRQVVLEVADALDIPVEQRTLPLGELRRADEALLTATTREVVPLVRVDGSDVGDGRPGPVTRRLLDGYRAEVARERRAGVPTGDEAS